MTQRDKGMSYETLQLMTPYESRIIGYLDTVGNKRSDSNRYRLHTLHGMAWHDMTRRDEKA